MKRKFLNFSTWKQRNAAPKLNTRRNRLRFGTVSYKTDGTEDKGGEEDKDADPNDSEEVKAIKRIGKQVTAFQATLGVKADKTEFETLQKQIKDLQEGIATLTGKEITASIKSINDANEKIWKQIAEMQEEAAKDKETSSGSSVKGGVKINRKDVEAFVKATFNDKGEKTHNAASVQIKAAEIMGVANFFEGGEDTDTTAFTGRVVDPRLYQRRRKKNLILDNFTIQTINSPTLLYLIKVEEGDSNSVSGDPGGAEWILSSEAKPMRSFRVTTGKAEAKKIAIFGTVEDKLLRDIPSLENWLREDFMQEMREGINDGLLNNDADVNDKAPQGMKQDAILFTPSEAFDGTIDEVNYIDMILAIAAMFSDNKEQLDRVFVAGDVLYRIMGLKDDNGRYQNNNLVYINDLGQLFIGGVPVIEADSDDIPSTHVLAVGADLGFKMKAYGPMVFERGLNGEDFRYDRTSFRGYQEFLTYLPTHMEKTVMYDTWENIEAAIAAASA